MVLFYIFQFLLLAFCRWHRFFKWCKIVFDYATKQVNKVHDFILLLLYHFFTFIIPDHFIEKLRLRYFFSTRQKAIVIALISLISGTLFVVDYFSS